MHIWPWVNSQENRIGIIYTYAPIVVELRTVRIHIIHIIWVCCNIIVKLHHTAPFPTFSFCSTIPIYVLHFPFPIHFFPLYYYCNIQCHLPVINGEHTQSQKNTRCKVDVKKVLKLNLNTKRDKKHQNVKWIKQSIYVTSMHSAS